MITLLVFAVIATCSIAIPVLLIALMYAVSKALLNFAKEILRS